MPRAIWDVRFFGRPSEFWTAKGHSMRANRDQRPDEKEKKNGIAPFDRLVEQVMTQDPYRSAKRVFWIVDNGSSHRGQACAERLRKRWPNLIVVNTPVHASWLNQVEIYFSIVQRKVLTPVDFESLHQLEDALLRFQDYYALSARPFQWKFTRADLEQRLSRIALARSRLIRHRTYGGND